jgi:phospholipid transport system substrate-binding protein
MGSGPSAASSAGVVHRIAACLALCLSLVAAAAAGQEARAASPERTPSQVIDGLHEVLLDVMKNAETWGYEGREKRLAPAIPKYYDVEFMAEKSVGRHWDKATEEERKRFLATFLRFMVANYAGQFDGYSGQHFETLSEEPARLDTVLVKTVLVNPAGDDVALNYRMRKVDGAWKVIDVYLDGTVSELALRRSEFSGIVKREDFDALIAAIDERIEKLAAGTES